MATRDTYTKQIWENLPAKNTPLKSERLLHIEQGIKDASDNRALKEIYDDDHIKLMLQKTASSTTSAYTNIVEIGYEGSEPEDGGEPTGESYIYKLDKEGNAYFSGDVKTEAGASLNALKEAFENSGGGDIPIATVQTPGKVKPDGTTITIDADGTIHAVSSQELAESILGGES